MAKYVDGFVLPVPKKNIRAYRRMSRMAGKVWMEHGALEYRECIGDDLKVKGVAQFPRTVKSRSGETVMFSWIVFKSRKHRDKVNARVMRDPRMDTFMPVMPFDVKRMVYGGFEVLVDL